MLKADAVKLKLALKKKKKKVYQKKNPPSTNSNLIILHSLLQLAGIRDIRFGGNLK